MDKANVTSSTNSGTEVIETRREVSLIAAAHAALDPARRAHRNDILVEASLRVLAERGHATIDQVVRDLNRLFRTSALTPPLVGRAMEDAEEAELVVRRKPLFGPDEWGLSDDALRETQEDAVWAQLVVSRFDDGVIERLQDDPDRGSIKEERLPKLAALVRAAIATGAEGLYLVEPASVVDTLRPVRFNERAALEVLAAVEPKPVRQAIERVLLAALNPDIDFGDEYIHLVVASNVLHGLVTRRDVATMPRLVGVRIVLDTSVLVDLASPDEWERSSVEEVIRMSTSLGAQVVVPQHTVDEWINLFDAATQEIGDAAFDSTKLAGLAPLASNVFVGRFLGALQDQPELTWQVFRQKWRDPSKEFVKRQVVVRPHGNDRPEDRIAVEEFAKQLRVTNRKRAEERGRQLRKADAIAADAETVAMLSRWRKKYGADGAYFVARDRLTAEAYKAARPTDPVSLVVTVPAWLMLVGAMTTDDPDKRAEVAKVIGNTALRDSFLSLAACYTFEEIRAMSSALGAEPTAPDAEDVTAFVQQTLDGFEMEANRPDRVADARLRGSQLLGKRAGRRNQRAQRAHRVVDQAIAAAVGKAEKEAKVAAAAAEYESASRLSAEKQKTEDVTGELARSKDRERLLARVLVAVVVSLLAVGVGLVLWISGVVASGDARLRMALAVGLVVAGAMLFAVSKLKAALAFFALSVIVPIAVNLLTR